MNESKDNCSVCGEPWDKHEFEVPHPFCPKEPLPDQSWYKKEVKKDIRCSVCRSEFVFNDIKSTGCPNCGSNFIPCLIKNDIKIVINTHELRTLFIWAERFVDTWPENDNKQTVEKSFAKTFLDKLAQNTENQLESWTPLGWNRELRDLQENLPKCKIEVIKSE